jgi:hypothetical protein
MKAKGNVKEATIEVVVMRANGQRENFGVVSYWHKNPLKRLEWRIRQWLRSS